MLDVKELMIGNFIYWDIPEKIGIDHRVVSIMDNSINTIPISFSDNLKNYKPIPLTEDWLLGFGFEKKSLHNFNNDFYFVKNRLFFCEYTHEKICYENRALDISIKYVHQWQNLYFMLTGKYLVLNKN